MSKSADAFRTISEVSEWLETPAHVLRFWESKFTQVKPVKRAGGRRYYRPGDMELLGGIKKLLHEDGMTIKGVQKVLREQGVRYVASLSTPVDGEAHDPELIEDAPYMEVEDTPGEVVAFPRMQAVDDVAAANEGEPDALSADDGDDPELEAALSPHASDFDAPDDGLPDDMPPDFDDVPLMAEETLVEEETGLAPLPPIEDENDSPPAETDLVSGDTDSDDPSSPEDDLSAAADEDDSLMCAAPSDMSQAEMKQADANQGAFAFDTPDLLDPQAENDAVIEHDALAPGAAALEPLDLLAEDDALAPLPDIEAEIEAEEPQDAQPEPAPSEDPEALSFEEVFAQEEARAAEDMSDADGLTDHMAPEEDAPEDWNAAEAEAAVSEHEPTDLAPAEVVEDAMQPATDVSEEVPLSDSDLTDALATEETAFEDAKPQPAAAPPRQAARGLPLPDFSRPEDAGPDQVNPGLLGYAARARALSPEAAAQIARQFPALRARVTRLSNDPF